MSIKVNEQEKVFHLQTPDSSYIFRVYGKSRLLHLYYGKKINDHAHLEDSLRWFGAGGASIDAEFAHLGSKSVSFDILPQEYGFFGSPDLRKPAFHAQYADGSRITCPVYEGYRITPSKPRLEGLPSVYTENDSECDTLEIFMKDEVTGLRLTYLYSVFNDRDVITRTVIAHNEGKQNIDIKAIMSLMIDFKDDDFDLIHLEGNWARERHVERVPLSRMGANVYSRRGLSAHDHSPFLALARKNADEEHGDVYGFSFVYSGNFEAGVESDRYNQARVYMGINSFDFNWRLEPGQSFTAPEAVAVFSSKGLGGMSRTFHKLYKSRLCRGKFRDKVERPVLINNWEGTRFAFTEEKILDMAKIAKRVGVELFVLDDGWFGKRDEADSSLGDWYPHKEKLPDGVAGLAKKINDLGLDFGLWFEPEMVSPDSDLYRAHPDWALHVEGRGMSQGRNQYVLDLTRKEVQDYIVKFMTENLESAPIVYVKWDYNRHLTEVGSASVPPERQAEVSHRYMLGLYSVLERLRARFPDILFEGCSGGGGRFDAGMLYYFDQYWTSDMTDVVERQFIQEGTSMVMPAITMGSHVSICPNVHIKRVSPLRARGYCAMCGQFGYELDITKCSEEELDEIAEQSVFYKSIREIIHSGEMYRVRSPKGRDGAAWEYISEDGKSVAFAVFNILAYPSNYPRRLRMTALDPDARYRLRGTDEVYDGAMLMYSGLAIQPMDDFDGQMFIFDKE